MRKYLRQTMMLVSLLTLSSFTQAAAQSPPFAGLAGGWSGSGTIELADGSRERLRCRATYRVSDEGAHLKQGLRCASDSYRFDLSSDLIAERGAISGSWQETSRNVSGSVSGRTSGGTISAVADAPGFSAQLSVAIRGDRQSVSISSAGDIKNVSISLTRG